MNNKAKYSIQELILNWLIFISLFLALLFGTLFSLYSKDISIKSINQIGKIKFSSPSSEFSIVAFLFLIVNLTSLILKIIVIRKRKKKGIKNGQKNTN